MASTDCQCRSDPTFFSQAAIDACWFSWSPHLMKRRRVGWEGGGELSVARALRDASYQPGRLLFGGVYLLHSMEAFLRAVRLRPVHLGLSLRLCIEVILGIAYASQNTMDEHLQARARRGMAEVFTAAKLRQGSVRSF